MSTKVSPLENSQRRAVGKPAGEAHLALLQAAQALRLERVWPHGNGQGATLCELVQRACVGYKVARVLVPKLKKRGQLEIVGSRCVPGRNRPVAEYAPARTVADIFEDSGRVALSQCIAGWGK